MSRAGNYRPQTTPIRNHLGHLTGVAAVVEHAAGDVANIVLALICGDQSSKISCDHKARPAAAAWRKTLLTPNDPSDRLIDERGDIAVEQGATAWRMEGGRAAESLLTLRLGLIAYPLLDKRPAHERADQSDRNAAQLRIVGQRFAEVPARRREAADGT